MPDEKKNVSATDAAASKKAVREILERLEYITKDDFADISERILADQRAETASRAKVIREIEERLERIRPDDLITILDRAFIFGVPAFELVKSFDKVQDTILKTCGPIRELPYFEPPYMEATDSYWKGKRPIGGIPIEHAHVGDSVVVLDKARAAALNKEILAEFNFDLAAANAISFGSPISR